MNPRRSYPVLVSLYTGIYPLQETSHLFHGLDRYQLYAVLISQDLYRLARNYPH